MKKLYRLFLLSGKFDELGDNIQRGLQETFKGKQFKLLSLVQAPLFSREELFSTFWVLRSFLTRVTFTSGQKDGYLFRRYNELDLLPI